MAVLPGGQKRSRNNEVTLLPRWPAGGGGGGGSTVFKFLDFQHVFQLTILDFACKDIKKSHTAQCRHPPKVVA